MPVSSTNHNHHNKSNNHMDPSAAVVPHTFTTTSSNVGATKKRRSEAERNKTPSRQVLSQHTASSIRSATTPLLPSSTSTSGLFLTMDDCLLSNTNTTTANGIATAASSSSSVSPTTLLKQTGKDFEASRSAATRRVAARTPVRTRHASPPSIPTKPRALAGRLVGGGKRRHSEAEEDIFGAHTTIKKSSPSTTTVNINNGRFTGGRDRDVGVEDDDGDLRLLWERELSISSNVEKQQREESQQHYRNLLFAPKKSVSTHHSESGCMGRDADMSCSSFPGGISDPTTTTTTTTNTNNNNCNEITDLCRGATPTMRYEGGCGGGGGVSPISLFGAASPSPPVPFSGCGGSSIFPPTVEAMNHYRQQSPFHRFAPPTSFPSTTARASSLASNATSITTICAKPTTTTTATTARNNNSNTARLFSPPPSLRERCTTPPAKGCYGGRAEMDDDPLTESQYVTLNNDGGDNNTCTTNTRIRGGKKTVARRRLNVIAESNGDDVDNDHSPTTSSGVNRYLDFPCNMMDDDDDDVVDCHVSSFKHSSADTNHSNWDVDPTLALVMPVGGCGSSQHQRCGSTQQFHGDSITTKSSSSHTTTTTTPPHHQQQDRGVVWKAQANEWASRTQAFFDELDQRPLHEVQPGATSTSR